MRLMNNNHNQTAIKMDNFLFSSSSKHSMHYHFLQANKKSSAVKFGFGN